MEVVHVPGDFGRPTHGCAVSIGAYDGVHAGHRRLIARLREKAAELGCAAAVVVFDRHPATVVRPGSAPLLLTGLDHKLELLDGAGVDLTAVLRFDEPRSREPPEDFVTEVLVNRLGGRAVVVGQDFHFGWRRAGDVALLRRMGAALGLEVTGVELYAAGPNGSVVSSTRIRALLAAGRVGEAAGMLGRPHQVRGTVGHGDRRGRQLGFPTANVDVPPGIQLPADGVYAGWYSRPAGPPHAAAISVGRRPTFHSEEHGPVVEAYLLDFAGDLYGEQARVDFVANLRDQVRYQAAGDLSAQIARDVVATRAALGPPR
ncbi:MAG: bifunctional riboflavin kinase/FAD synthetase [Acidimicrobiales bacterium]